MFYVYNFLQKTGLVYHFLQIISAALILHRIFLQHRNIFLKQPSKYTTAYGGAFISDNKVKTRKYPKNHNATGGYSHLT